MRAELLFSCAYARTYARFFSPSVLGICSFSSVVVVVVVVFFTLTDRASRGEYYFPCSTDHEQIGNLTRLIHTLLYVMTIHTQ